MHTSLAPLSRRLRVALTAIALALSVHSGLVSQQIRVYAPDGVSAASVDRVRKLATEGLAQLAPSFPGTPTHSILVVVHQSAARAPDSIQTLLHDGTAGLAMLGRHEIHLMLEEANRLPPNDLKTVVDHELVHVLLDQHLMREGGMASRYVSRWFHEGLAQALSQGPYIGMSEEDLVATLHFGRELRLADIRRSFPHERSGLRRAYAQSFSFVAFLLRRYDLDTLLGAARMSTEEGGFRAGFVELTGKPMVFTVDAWRDYVLGRSGATLRFVMQNCFSYVMIFAFVLLAIAGIRKWRREDAIRAKFDREDAASRRAAKETAQLPPRAEGQDADTPP